MTTQWVQTACPHDCPSGCALEVELLERGDGEPPRIGRVRGNPRNDYTLGVICAKVSRYAEQVHHPDRLTRPLRRVGAKGSGSFEPISWDEALDAVAGAFRAAEARHGPEAVWLYHSGGTLGVVQRYGQERLRNVMGYSGFNATICVTPAVSGWLAGVGQMMGPDPREIAETDLAVLWGCNAVATQINLMKHVTRARRRGAKLVVVDVYRTPTAEQADLALILRPGTDGALACAVMHLLLKEGYADRDFLASRTDFSLQVERHLAERTPAWAAGITGLAESEIVEFARLYGNTPRSFIRLGFGFARSRNGAPNLHAVSCLPSITNAWRHRGGGAYLIYWNLGGLDNTLIQGLDVKPEGVRVLDQSRIGAVLTGEEEALLGGPPVEALLIQNGNPAVVSPDSARVRRGLSREDLFTCVHEQFLTETARHADIVLPATTFLECGDLYSSYGQSYVTAAPQVIEPIGEARSNHHVICELASRLGADHPGFRMSEWELLDDALARAGLPDGETVRRQGWLDAAPEFATAHFLEGFPTPDGRFRFAPDWAALGPYYQGLPALPDHAPLIDAATPELPFRLVAPPARSFLNSSFNGSPAGRAREGRPTLRIHPEDAERLAIPEGGPVRIGNQRGSLHLHATRFDGLQPGTVVVEGLWANRDFKEGIGINLLVGADPVPPAGGVAFHDTAVWVEAVGGEG